MHQTIGLISNWTLLALFFIGVPINVLSLWLLLQKMFNFGAGGQNEKSNSIAQKLKTFSMKCSRKAVPRSQSFNDRSYLNSTSSLATVGVTCKRPKKRPKRSMIHTLLLILCISDLCVLVGLVALFSLPNIVPLFEKQFYHFAPFLIPISQIALLTSEYATVLISFERYVRIVYVCNLRICRFFNEDNFKYYVLLLLIAPTIFFLPKFYEIRTEYRLYRIQKTYNCTEIFQNDTFENHFELIENMGISSINTTIFGNQFNREQHKMEFVCNESKYLIESLVENKVPLSVDLKNDSYQCEPQKELVDPSRISSDANDTFHMDYNIETRVARVCRKIVYPFIDRTDLRKNRLYYKIYILGLTTMFAQIIPMGILIYLNIKICLALNTATGDTLNATIKRQRKNNEKGFKARFSSNGDKQVKGIGQSSKSFKIQRFKFPKYNKSRSIDKDTYGMHEELETPLSLSKSNQHDDNVHENHKLCLSSCRKEISRFSKLKKQQNYQDNKSQIEKSRVCSRSECDEIETSSIRELRPFNPLLHTAHLESEPIKVIIDYVDSPTEVNSSFSQTCAKCLSDEEEHESTVLVHSPAHSNMSSITNIGNINDKSNISETQNPIFTLQNESSPSFASHNGYNTTKQHVPKSCQCSKSTARKLCEYPRENVKTKFTNTHHNGRKANNENKPSLQKMKKSDNSKQIDVVDKEKGCHWTCGTKMFSKSEKSMTRASIAIVWLFIFCHIWRMVPNIYEAIYPEYPDAGPGHSPVWLHYFSLASHILILLNSSINFLIYLF